MNKVGILLDSTAYMDLETVKKYNFYIASLTVNFDEKSFVEKHGDKETLGEIFTEIKQRKNLPKTSQPSAGSFLEQYEKAINDGCTKIYAFHLSGKLSGTVQGSIQAAEMIKEDHPEVEIEVFDSLQVAQLLTLFAIEFYEKIQKEVLTRSQVEQFIADFSKVSKIYLIVDNLDHLLYGGRISASKAAIGNMFNIKPILSFEKGELDKYGTARSLKAGYLKLIQILVEEMKTNESIYDIFVTGTGDAKMYEVLESEITKNVGNRACFINQERLGPVIGIHVGPDALGIGWKRRI